MGLDDDMGFAHEVRGIVCQPLPIINFIFHHPFDLPSIRVILSVQPTLSGMNRNLEL
jgi:hypothetical protein